MPTYFMFAIVYSIGYIMPAMKQKTFPAKLRDIRISREMTQAELAKKLKVSQPYVAQLESGAKPNPTLDMLRRLAKALKVTVSELVE